MEILLAVVIIGLCLAGMAVGIMFKRPCLPGSCGGEGVRLGGEPLSCGACPKRAESGCAGPTDTACGPQDANACDDHACDVPADRRRTSETSSSTSSSS